MTDNQSSAMERTVWESNSQTKTISRPVTVPKSAQKLENRQLELQLDLLSLQKKEKELIDALENVNVALADLGIPSSMIYASDMEEAANATKVKSDDPKQRNLQRMKSSGINMKDTEKLSFRGEDKACEYFQMLDLNRDSFIGYSEFRGKRHH